jgi:hypothetical protein
MPERLGMLKTITGADSLENFHQSSIIHRFEGVARWHEMF